MVKHNNSDAYHISGGSDKKKKLIGTIIMNDQEVVDDLTRLWKESMSDLAKLKQKHTILKEKYNNLLYSVGGVCIFIMVLTLFFLS